MSGKPVHYSWERYARELEEVIDKWSAAFDQERSRADAHHEKAGATGRETCAACRLFLRSVADREVP